ncbi:uncharacterized protein OCT59_013627 [Rhizophagus irregularis]|uniref:MIR domain-containing protein n=2 Tax=Rhizophagus irregularis TaxID=588596 RepID=A0A015K6F4_RHIIW|nr:hypothetical protein GLOIN_2v1473607 [Rhizophagus irregularis DAOM 181602=DAOM 197198]EXX63069.1 hypothetical protein RirG_155800 [Rhizophagus irregularis DAOM 197198w]POG77836.1 hypothetical protein GLOIN_2v1473607 [Rhizophagus irregularis DAOM 181602=DAOM 197198]UZO21228.1 hypothetical protein OCT59_013627 [Rhizophagus irregularis]GBC45759.2 hypothetical protein GLOIN_2v1473607 [Rhizophagus irregularis DAOM 181602=DAOM 197198]|eukprot:XP_025184702.1 hypothetical protein GLOIN_2v1473607 [Rhizophagus irregularis DAOM 181602=DAOM 197198]
MNYFPKYDGNIHPDEWINDIIKYYNMWEGSYGGFLITVKSLINPNIILPTEINDLVKLRDALKKDITFTTFKNLNKRKLQSLEYKSERDGGDTLKFLTDFRNLCYNSEINDIEEQKKYFIKALSNYYYFLSNFGKRMNNISSMNELIKEFEEIVMDESNTIRSGSIVALKHVATGKYLTSIEGLYYATGSKNQLVSMGSSILDSNALWKIYNCDNNNNNGFIKTNLCLEHKISKYCLGICHQIVIHQNHQSQYQNQYQYHKSPSSNHTEVNCNNGSETIWKICYDSGLENYEGYLKSNDIVNLSIIKKRYGTQDGQVEFLCSHDAQFTIGSDTFQEVFCNERLGENDEWCVELIKQA